MLTLQPGDIFAEHYQLKRLIDTGGFAEVWEAVFLTAGNTVALKIYPKLDAEGVKNIEDEYLNQAELSHSNLLIARYFGKFNGYPFLEMRYCAGGNGSARLGSCSEEEIARCLAQIASALAYLHSNGIVHQDVKPNNFLLDAKGNYYLADLGLSLRVRSTIRKYTQTRSSKADSIYAGLTPPPYRGPELYDRSGGTSAGPVMATDIWALGASLYEMITGDVPLGEFGGLMQLSQPDTPDLPEGFSAELNRIIKKCLSKQTWDRPRATELHQWAQQYLDKGIYGMPADEPAPQDSTVIDSNVNKGNNTIRDNNTSRDNNGTIRDGGTMPQKLVPEPPTPTPRPVWQRWAVIAVVAVLAAFGIKWVIDKNPTPKITAVTLTTDTPPKKDTVINKPGPKPETPPDTGTTKPDPKPINPNIIDHPSIGVRPRNGNIDIVRIEKTPSSLDITFRVKKFTNNTPISIYGPEDTDHCFYVKAGGIKYRLLSVDKKGKGITFTTPYYTFTASFHKIPKETRKINVMEGEDQDSPDSNYWNFYDVSVTNN